MSTLFEKLPLPQRREEMIKACVTLIESEVQRKSGLTGFAIKAGYRVLKAIKPTVVRDVLDSLFDEFIDALEPHHVNYMTQPPNGSFGEYLQAHTGGVADALVAVTDRKASRAKHKALKQAYQKLRPSAVRNVEEAIPQFKALMDQFYNCQ